MMLADNFISEHLFPEQHEFVKDHNVLFVISYIICCKMHNDKSAQIQKGNIHKYNITVLFQNYLKL